MKKILVVIDMQNDFIDGILGTKEAEQIVPAVVKRIQEFEGEVLFTRDTHTEEYLQTAEGKKLPVRHCIRGTRGWELHPEIEAMREKKDAVVFDKITFGSTELASYLREHLQSFGGISAIVLCGLCTDICVISNALLLKAFLPEVPILVDASCCAGVTVESHRNALNVMEMCQIDVVE